MTVDKSMSVLFARDGDLFVPSTLTRGPGHPDAQHGSAPAALLATCAEKAAGKTLDVGRRGVTAVGRDRADRALGAKSIDRPDRRTIVMVAPASPAPDK